jgi:hypothetical protein
MSANSVGVVSRPTTRVPLAGVLNQTGGSNNIQSQSACVPGLFQQTSKAFFIKDADEFVHKNDLGALVDCGLITADELRKLAYTNPALMMTLTCDHVASSLGLDVSTIENSYNYNDELGGRGL